MLLIVQPLLFNIYTFYEKENKKNGPFVFWKFPVQGKYGRKIIFFRPCMEQQHLEFRLEFGLQHAGGEVV